MVKTDLNFFLDIRNECSEFLHNNSKFTIEEATIWFEDTNPVYYIINYDDNDIGYFRMTNLMEEEISIGCDLHKDWRGKKLAYYAYIKFMMNLFDEYKSINLEVLDTNLVAHNLYKKLGFIEIKRTKFERGDIYSIFMHIDKELLMKKNRRKYG